ncbi:unnamed protein product [Strongylus vulgaris]|uniref:Peptidase A1 domain-containing protein n=1 Tax=Strongylus vulgaris TaxID=40348 RepID=A0A3P7IV62_STRVU|nr:unnamed protein product [Strongylus vulgaris]
MSGISAGTFSKSDDEWEAKSATGTALNVGPLEFVQKIASQFEAKFSFQHFLYVVECDVNAAVNITIAGKDYTITSKNAIIHVDDKTCILAFKPFFGRSKAPQWTLGGPFLREFCNIHDVAGKQIGFAKAKSD